MRHATPQGLRRHVWPTRSGTPRTASTGRRGRRRPVSPRERGPAGGSSRNPARNHETPMSGTHRAMASGNLCGVIRTLAPSTPSVCRLADAPANDHPHGPQTSESKPIKVLPDGAVTVARCTLERGAIQNRHLAMENHFPHRFIEGMEDLFHGDRHCLKVGSQLLEIDRRQAECRLAYTSGIMGPLAFLSFALQATLTKAAPGGLSWPSPISVRIANRPIRCRS
jgi:hypothetical protein